MSEVSTFEPGVEQRLRRVTEQFNNFVKKQKSDILDAKEAHYSQIRQLRNEQRELSRALEELEVKEKELSQEIDRDISYASSTESRLNDLRDREKLLKQERNTLESRVVELKVKVQERHDQYITLKENQTTQTERNLPELLVYERLLGFKIEGIKDDLLKFVFTNINSQRPSQEYTIEVDVSDHLYKVPALNPQIPESQLKTIVDQFNETRDLTQFLKNSRTAFRNLV